MGCKTLFNCKQLAWSIKNIDTKRWETVARSLCGKGIREKFVQNPHLMKVLIEKTENKTIVECANDRLWGNGNALSEESCLNRDTWVSQGILGQILEDIRIEFVSSGPPMSIHQNMSTPLMGYVHSFQQPASSMYESHPRHTIASQPNAFHQTQLPPNLLVSTMTDMPINNAVSSGISCTATPAANIITTPIVVTTGTTPSEVVPAASSNQLLTEDMDTGSIASAPATEENT